MCGCGCWSAAYTICISRWLVRQAAQPSPKTTAAITVVAALAIAVPVTRSACTAAAVATSRGADPSRHLRQIVASFRFLPGRAGTRIVIGRTAVCRVPSAARARKAHWSRRKGPFRPKCAVGAIARADEVLAGLTRLHRCNLLRGQVRLASMMRDPAKTGSTVWRGPRQSAAPRFKAVRLIPRDRLAWAMVIFDDVLICFRTSDCSSTRSCSETWARL